MVELAVMAGVTFVLAVLGPFGTFETGLGRRLVIWAIFTFGGYVCFRPVIAAGDALAAQSPVPRWAAIAVACVVASMPTTLIVAATFAGLRWRSVTADDLAALYPQVLIVGATVTVVQLLLHRRRPSDAAVIEPVPVPAAAAGMVEAIDPAPTPNALLDKLPPHIGRDILCVENEDHYVRVHTTGGSALILMRLRDAVALLAAIDGEQVHRSWWVARRAVGDVVRVQRRIALRLVDGRVIPVSRSAAVTLRDRGWL